TYGGNGGRIVLPESKATFDGIFDHKGLTPIRMTHIRDGASGTLLFGERLIHDAGLGSWLKAPIEPPPDPPIQAMYSHTAWSPAGPWAPAGVLLSSSGTINFSYPRVYVPPPPPPPPLPDLPPPPVPWDELAEAWYIRLTAYGSEHPGGA